MIFGEKNDKVRLHIGEAVIEENDEEEILLGITLDRKLTYLQSLCKKQDRNCMRYPTFRFPWIRKDKTRDEQFCNVTIQLLSTDLVVPR